MINLDKLISICHRRLQEAGYSESYINFSLRCWNLFKAWRNKESSLKDTEVEEFCQHIERTSKNYSKTYYRKISRAIRLLICYQNFGNFEYRYVKQNSPSFNKLPFVEEFTLQKFNGAYIKESTRKEKKGVLYLLDQYLTNKNLEISDITIDHIENYIKTFDKTSSIRIKCATLKQYFNFIFNKGLTQINLSVAVLPVNKKAFQSSPSTYSEDEIKEILMSIDRSSAIGKRDYLIILLAAEYGLRCGDIRSIKFKHINWNDNIIKFKQQKTGKTLSLYLVASVGNAIIDWIKHGRPETDAEEIIVSLEQRNAGHPLTSPTLYSIFNKYLRKTSAKDKNKTRHGLHAVRFSVATNMLKKKVAIPIIGSILGHSSTETTKIYLKLDEDSLRLCALNPPALNSRMFQV